MAKKYTLYFRGIDSNGKNQNFPIVSLDLKTMDTFTSYYKNYLELFNCLPNNVKDFIKENLSYNLDITTNEELKKLLYITDNDFTPIMDVIFENDLDVLYIEPKELEELLIYNIMTVREFQKSVLKTTKSLKEDDKYTFFSYLYNNYVKGKKIECMIDTYDILKYNYNLDDENIIIGAIATNKTNLMLLSKKFSQTLESRRNLSFEIKKLFKGKELINDYKKEIRHNPIDLSIVKLSIDNNILKFKNNNIN